ncbi:MAG: TIGR04255 family protein [Pseudonocardiaceae bacterium]
MTNPSVSFARPPVVEVVAGIAFTNYNTDFSSILAAFWKEALRDRFPVLHQQPPYAPPEEQFSEYPVTGFNFQFAGEFPAARLWASTPDGSELIQLQHDWFARNWRKVKPEDEYDRWPARRNALASSFIELDEYLSANGFARPVINQCEVSYINHVSLDDFPKGHGAIGGIIRGQSELSRSNPIENLTLQAAYILQEESQSAGRLHVALKPALNSSGIPIYVLELTVRSAPGRTGIESALSFLDKGRDAINSAFVALTTDEMHEKWGIQR